MLEKDVSFGVVQKDLEHLRTFRSIEFTRSWQDQDRDVHSEQRPTTHPVRFNSFFLILIGSKERYVYGKTPSTVDNIRRESDE